MTTVITQTIRITSILGVNNAKAMFAGVPVENGVTKETRSLFRIATKTESLGGMAPRVGQHWKIKGEGELKLEKLKGIPWKVTYFENCECECVIPDNHEAFVEFIANDKAFKGIRKSKAWELVKAFPNNPYKAVIASRADDLADATSLTVETARRLKEGFRKYQNLSHAKWLTNLGVPLSVVTRLIKHHGEKTIRLIEENPWRLMDFGLSYDKSGEIARELLSKGDNAISVQEFLQHPYRLIAAVEDVMMWLSRQRHNTLATKSDIKKRLDTHIKGLGADKLKEAAITLSLKAKKIVQVSETEFQATGTYVMEAVIAKRLRKLVSIEKWDIEEDVAFAKAIEDMPFLNDMQKLSIRNSVTYGTSVITGGSGTGKTTTLRGVLRTYVELGYTVQGVALAGRASKRLYESTGCLCSTIAKFLKQDPPKDNEKYVLVIDETSMVDVRSMFNMVTHLPDTARIIMVGDVQQLPPIGEGRVFADVINSSIVPTVALTKVERHDDDSDIASYANEIINSRIPPSLSGKNVTFYDVPVEQIEKKITQIISSSPEEIQVVAATRKGAEQLHAGVSQINVAVQTAFNPLGEKITSSNNNEFDYTDIRKGDRIVFTRNNYDLGVWNGTLGEVVGVQATGEVLAQIRTDDDELIDVTYSTIPDIELSYALTAHKVQGSQFKRIIVVVTNPGMIDCSWLYTAITRAESHVDIVGPKDLFISAIGKRPSADKRQTNLVSLLKGNFILNKA